MRSPALTSLVSVLAFGLLGCSSEGPTSSKSGEAVTALREVWKEHPVHFWLGTVQFRRGNSAGPGFTALSSYGGYQAAAKLGLLTLQNERDLSGAFTGWDDWFKLTQAGVQRIATVALTPKGAEIGKLYPLGEQKDATVRFIIGEYLIEEVLSNEPVEINMEKYSVVLGTHVFQARPEFNNAALAEMSVPTYRERRFRALLKHDPFGGKWSLQASDFGPRETDFQTQMVPSAIAQLRLTGTR